MRRALLLGLTLTMVLVGCGRIRDSRLNPFNWFGRAERTQVVAAEVDVAVDGRQLVADVTDLVLDRTTGGVIVRATGVPPTQGFWEAELVARPTAEGDDPGLVVYDFRVFPPVSQAAVSTRQSREITVATFLSDIKLDTIRQITVQGANSARTTRR